MRKAKAAAGCGHRLAAPETRWEEWVSTDSTAGNGNGEALREKIAQLAYSYWEARGYQHGSAEEDWYRAETEVLGQG